MIVYSFSQGEQFLNFSSFINCSFLFVHVKHNKIIHILYMEADPYEENDVFPID
jgi:hypothetical protein